MSETQNDKQWRILDKWEHTCCWDATIIDEDDRMIVECDKITAAFIVWNIEKIKELEKRIAFALSDEGAEKMAEYLYAYYGKSTLAFDCMPKTTQDAYLGVARDCIRAALQVKL